MNEELQTALADMIKKTVQGTEAFVEFGQQEIPIVVEQLLMWKITEAFFFIIVLLSIVVLFIWFWRQDYKRSLVNKKCTVLYNYGTEWGSCPPTLNDDISIVYTMAGGTASLCCFLIALINIKTIIYIWVAPKVYLLEYAADLVK